MSKKRLKKPISKKAEFISDNFGNQFLNGVCYHCIFSSDFLKKVITILPLEVYRSKERKIIMNMLYDYYNQYKSAPENLFYDLFQELEKELSDSEYDRCMALIGILKGFSGKNYQYYLDRLNDSLKHFYLEEGSVEFASLIKRKKYDEAKAVILKAMKATEDSGENEYYDYFEDKTYIEKRLSETKYTMQTKIAAIDKYINGLNPTWLVTILAATKMGKSWMLMEMAVAALFQNLNVLFISLEMNKEQVDSRFDQVIGFMSSVESDEPQEVMDYKREEWQKENKVVESIFDIGTVEKNRKRFRKIGGGNLKVMAFNRGRMNYLDVDRILDTAEEQDGFVADVLVVDYLGIMKETAQGQSKKERIGENCLGIKEICGKRNLIGFTAMQGNRKAMMAKTFHSHMVADDIDTIFHSDLVLAMCATKQEEEQNKYRVYCANYRHGVQHWSVGIIRCLNQGQIALDSYELEEGWEGGDDDDDENNGTYY
jgi:hypothetical protein